MSKNKDLIINVTSSEITIALLEERRLVELNKERSQKGFAVGDIYLGKVRKIMPGLNAAFVNIGADKDAFIHYLDLGPQFTTLNKLIRESVTNKRTPKFENIKLDPPIGKSGKISTFLSTGHSVVVQVAKEAISTKGPRLTSEISLAGRHLVLIPFSNKVSFSKKIRSAAERKRLKKIIDSVLPQNYGVIVRTVAVDKDQSDIESDLTSLVAKWESVLANLKTQEAPALLLNEMNRATTIIRDLLNGSFNSIYVDDPAFYDEIRGYIREIAPDKEKIVKRHKGNDQILDRFDITRQIQGLFSKFVTLQKGAYLIIEHTEALHVIDVNSGNRSKMGDDQERAALSVNMLAAEEIARQLRLRDMGGIIVIDFIDLHKSENRQALYGHMKSLMADDRAKHTILPITKFGLMQITRQRVRPEVLANISEKCPTCNGTGEITPTALLDEQIESRVSHYVSTKELKRIKLVVSPFVEAFLNKGIFSLRKRWMMKYKCKIKIVADQTVGFIETKYFDENENELT